jgi:hypothetical protein
MDCLVSLVSPLYPRHPLSPETSPETNFARHLHADTTTTTGLPIIAISIVVVLSCRVSKPCHETFGTRSFNNAVDPTAAPDTLP